MATIIAAITNATTTNNKMRFMSIPFPLGRGALCCASAVRQPGYLPQVSTRRPMGFASPLRSGFAFIAAPECAHMRGQ
jgi:hypothetical protein